MSDWKYSLESEGARLRTLINNQESTIENLVEIYNQMIVCLKSWEKKINKPDLENWEYDIGSMIEDLECATPDVGDEELIYEDEENNLNYYLDEFYSMCDHARVWIGIN
jgi:hypothetical protein